MECSFLILRKMSVFVSHTQSSKANTTLNFHKFHTSRTFLYKEYKERRAAGNLVDCLWLKTRMEINIEGLHPGFFDTGPALTNNCVMSFVKRKRITRQRKTNKKSKDL